MILAELPALEYVDQGHQYLIERTRRPSVTDSLRDNNLIDLTWCTEEARWRGRRAHQGCKVISKSQVDPTIELDWSTVDDGIAGFLRSYLRFLEHTRFQVLGYETPLYHPQLLYGGMPDVYGLLHGVPTLIDFKTGAVQPWCAFQTALYVMALTKLLPGALSPYSFKRYGMRLREDGGLPKLEPFADANDFALATSLISITNWKLNHGYDLWRNAS